jgi:D-2-hydroxyacid dehydrogenase (NADP+)
MALMGTPVMAVSERMAGILGDRAAKRGVAVDFVTLSDDGAPPDTARPIDAVLSTGLSPARLSRLLRDHPSIRWVAAQNAGVDGILVPEIVERGITVTRVRHVHDTYVAEFAMALILAAAKRLPEIVRAQDHKEWVHFQPALVRGQSLVIAGYGEIGQALARRAKAFDMRVLGLRTRPQPDGVADEVWAADRLDEALGLADFMVLAVPGGAGRRHMIGEKQLRLLRPSAYLINVGRGEVVDEAALDRVLREGGFAGALIDTFEVEPLPQSSPLWTNPRVLVTGHIAGIRAGPVGEAVLDQLVENMARFGRGEPLLNTVDVRRGY